MGSQALQHPGDISASFCTSICRSLGFTVKARSILPGLTEIAKLVERTVPLWCVYPAPCWTEGSMTGRTGTASHSKRSTSTYRQSLVIAVPHSENRTRLEKEEENYVGFGREK